MIKNKYKNIELTDNIKKQSSLLILENFTLMMSCQQYS